MNLSQIPPGDLQAILDLLDLKHGDFRFAPLESWWIFRLLLKTPFRKFVRGRWVTVGRTIFYPDSVPSCLKPEEKFLAWVRLNFSTVAHELVHVKQWQRPARFLLLYFLLPLPVLFSGRYWLEREAYQLERALGADIRPHEIAGWLWYSYFYAWPQSLAAQWFEEQGARWRNG